RTRTALRTPTTGRPSMRTRLLIPLLFAVLAASPAGAEIFKCVGKGRVPLYQNFPCPLDRLDSSSPTGRNTNPATPTPQGPEPPQVAVAAVRPASPRVGMTPDDVRAIWGEPINITTEEFAKKHVEVWQYADTRSIEFDRKGVVTAISW